MIDNIKKLKVIISCSGKFHAFALAEQLERHGMLETLYTSYSSIKNPLAKLVVSRRDLEKISFVKISTLLLVAFGLKIFKNPFFWNNLFDRWVAFQIKNSNANIFIGWGGMSLHSIKAAQKKGMITIVERGSCHISMQNILLIEEYKKFNVKFQIEQAVIEKENKEYNQSNYISIPSEFARQSFLSYKIDSNKLLVNHYGVSKHFSHLEGKPNDIFTILFLGKISVRKGFIYLIEAILRLNKRGIRVKGLFIGGIDSSIRNYIDNITHENIEFTGHINHYKLSNYISKSDVAVVPSIEDGFGMVVPQILACNVPVIVSENTGAADIINEGKNGYIIPIRSVKQIQEKIELLYNQPEKLLEMKSFIKNNPIDLSWDAYGERYIKFLSLLGNES